MPMASKAGEADTYKSYYVTCILKFCILVLNISISAHCGRNLFLFRNLTFFFKILDADKAFISKDICENKMQQVVCASKSH